MSALAVPFFYLVAGITAAIVGEIESHHHQQQDYGRRPQGTDGKPATPTNGEDGGTKTPDPVVTDGGADYAGLAHPVVGPITRRTRLGVGRVLRSSALAMDLTDQRRMVREVSQRLVARTRRKRPHHDTRSWNPLRKQLKFDTEHVRRIWHDFRGEWRRDVMNMRRAAEQLRDFQNAVGGGNFHLEL